MTNPLKLNSPMKGCLTLTAAEWAAEARERGFLDKAALWDEKAAELGLERIPNGIGVRFRDDGTTYRVEIARGPRPGAFYRTDKVA